MINESEAKNLDKILSYLSKKTLVHRESGGTSRYNSRELVIMNPFEGMSEFNFEPTNLDKVREELGFELDRINVLLDILYTDGYIGSNDKHSYKCYFCLNDKGYGFITYEGGYVKRRDEAVAERTKKNRLAFFNGAVMVLSVVAAGASAYFASRSQNNENQAMDEVHVLEAKVESQQRKLDSLGSYIMNMKKEPPILVDTTKSTLLRLEEIGGI